MGFIVTTRFADLEDGKRLYEAGDVFPRLGHYVNAERLASLAGSDNRIGYPLIKKVDEPDGNEKKPTKKRVKKND